MTCCSYFETTDPKTSVQCSVITQVGKKHVLVSVPCSSISIPRSYGLFLCLTGRSPGVKYSELPIGLDPTVVLPVS